MLCSLPYCSSSDVEVPSDVMECSLRQPPVKIHYLSSTQLVAPHTSHSHPTTTTIVTTDGEGRQQLDYWPQNKKMRLWNTVGSRHRLHHLLLFVVFGVMLCSVTSFLLRSCKSSWGRSSISKGTTDERNFEQNSCDWRRRE